MAVLAWDKIKRKSQRNKLVDGKRWLLILNNDKYVLNSNRGGRMSFLQGTEEEGFYNSEQAAGGGGTLERKRPERGDQLRRYVRTDEGTHRLNRNELDSSSPDSRRDQLPRRKEEILIARSARGEGAKKEEGRALSGLDAIKTRRLRKRREEERIVPTETGRGRREEKFD